MWRGLLRLLVLIALQDVVAGLDTTLNYFLHPQELSDGGYAEDQIWPLNTTQQITWSTNITDIYVITLWQINLDASGTQADSIPVSDLFTSAADQTGEHSFSWVVQLYVRNLTFSDVFSLYLHNAANDLYFSSHYFNISDAPTTTSSASSTSSVTPSPSSALASAITSTASAGALSSSPAATPNLKGNSHDLAIGLGVGLGIGIPIVLIAGIWIGFTIFARRKRSASRSGSPARPSGPPGGPGVTSYRPVSQRESTQYLSEAPAMSSKPHEIDASRPVQELEGNTYR